jgi:hypothetical protein
VVAFDSTSRTMRKWTEGRLCVDGAACIEKNNQWLLNSQLAIQARHVAVRLALAAFDCDCCKCMHMHVLRGATFEGVRAAKRGVAHSPGIDASRCGLADWRRWGPARG